MSAILYYIHDPMCSWCWGYRPVWDVLQQSLPAGIEVKYVAGGLAPDSNTPMPIEQQHAIKAHWHTIEEKLGTRFNFDFWRNNTPRRSTYNACRAVIAAHNQGYQAQMLNAIQCAYYLHALNPSDSDVLIDLAKGLHQQASSAELAFNSERFTDDFLSEETQQTLIQQIELARTLTHQGFPSLVLEYVGLRYPISLNYHDSIETLADITNILTKASIVDD